MMLFDPRAALAEIAKQARTPATSATFATQPPKKPSYVADVADVATPPAQKHEVDATPDQIANNILAEMRAAPNVEHMRAIRNNAPGIEAVKRGSPVRLIHMDNLIKQRESAK